jgi:hypothetical protein
MTSPHREEMRRLADRILAEIGRPAGKSGGRMEEESRMTRSGTLTLSAMATLATTVTSFWEVYGEEHPENMAFRHVHWQKVRDLDAEVRREHYSRVDLSRVDADMEALLYACVVLDHFTVRPLAEPGQVAAPPLYSAAQAGLRVVFERGSWLATWIKLEEPTFQPDCVRRQVLAITQSAAGTLRYRDLAAA